ncbi:hypothetical protein [Catellatospora tritici]|uniref:hypothetical protein n=1 Tax=Catellatospora tritici TaxID=2851566 RepID=UPI001C2D9EB2|nr:hypothetical protein [Catellatospora tritici]MBV1850688.1 hypothetical protein [Catellatospora tritici]MBV1850941.1 hypothetical protein [Catellatospora tritici]
MSARLRDLVGWLRRLFAGRGAAARRTLAVTADGTALVYVADPADQADAFGHDGADDPTAGLRPPTADRLGGRAADLDPSGSGTGSGPARPAAPQPGAQAVRPPRPVAQAVRPPHPVRARDSGQPSSVCPAVRPGTTQLPPRSVAAQAMAAEAVRVEAETAAAPARWADDASAQPRPLPDWIDSPADSPAGEGHRVEQQRLGQAHRRPGPAVVGDEPVSLATERTGSATEHGFGTPGSPEHDGVSGRSGWPGSQDAAWPTRFGGRAAAAPATPGTPPGADPPGSSQVDDLPGPRREGRGEARHDRLTGSGTGTAATADRDRTAAVRVHSDTSGWPAPSYGPEVSTQDDRAFEAVESWRGPTADAWTDAVLGRRSSRAPGQSATASGSAATPGPQPVRPGPGRAAQPSYPAYPAVSRARRQDWPHDAERLGPPGAAMITGPAAEAPWPSLDGPATVADPWPHLLDDTALWVAPDPSTPDPDRIHRLRREQEGQQWNA